MNSIELLDSLKDAAVMVQLNDAPVNVTIALNNVIGMLTPRKVLGSHTQCCCPTCGRRVRSGNGSSSRVRDKRCQDCGQVLDWSDFQYGRRVNGTD